MPAGEYPRRSNGGADDDDDEEDYSKLRDLRVSLDSDEVTSDGFSLCLWIYLSSSARPSSIILRQISLDKEDEVPFVALNGDNKLIIFPLMFVHEEAPSSGSSFPWTDLTYITADAECRLERWFHIGCEVAPNNLRFYVDGTLAGEKSLSSKTDDVRDCVRKLILVGNDGRDGKLHGFIYSYRLLHLSASVTDHFVKNPPVKISLDNSCVSEGIEESDDGVWSIIGGKASCRRNFSLEVALSDALGRSVHKEMEVVASLIYADNGAPVEKSRDDAEAPLLASCDGLEFPSTDWPITLLRGCATFKLKISQLSSKSDNRLFRVSFRATHAQRYPFFETFTPPIRCISRNRYVRPSVVIKRPSSASMLCGDTSVGANDSFGVSNDDGETRLQTFNQLESRSTPPVKRLKAGQTSVALQANITLDQKGIQNIEGTDSAPSDSDSTDAPKSENHWETDAVNAISDVIVFKYCLESTYERSVLLKVIVASISNQDMEKFAEQVSLYTGCLHHRSQILLSKQLLEQGDDTWRSIAGNNHRILWTDAVPEIDRRFMSIAHSPSRGLSVQDLEVLRGIAGCGEELGRENFDKMWYWFYPVAYTLSKGQINAMWKCISSKWIEGLITKEDAENSLKDIIGLQRPGTFVLRFPTSRSWPHPDAGSLLVTYVGHDNIIHHRLLSYDYSGNDNNREMSLRSLQDLLVEEPELSQLARVTRAVGGIC